MDAFFDKLMTDYGLLGIFLSGVVAYFLRAEVVFWRERDNYKQALQAAHDNFTAIMKERIVEQQKIMETFTNSIDKVEARVHDAEMEFVKLQETILAKLEQMQIQRNFQNSSQK